MNRLSEIVYADDSIDFGNLKDAIAFDEETADPMPTPAWEVFDAAQEIHFLSALRMGIMSSGNQSFDIRALPGCQRNKVEVETERSKGHFYSQRLGASSQQSCVQTALPM